MDNKLSELSKPVMYVVRTLDGSVASVKVHSYTAPKGFTSAPLYSQEYVSALLAELEAKESKIVELRDRGINAVTAEERTSTAWQKRAEAAEAKLATPVRLPEPCVYEVNGTRFYNRLSEVEVIAVLREQGFTVEGDE